VGRGYKACSMRGGLFVCWDQQPLSVDTVALHVFDNENAFMLKNKTVFYTSVLDMWDGGRVVIHRMKTALSDKFLLLVFGVLLFFFSFPTTFGHVAFFAWVALVPLLVLNRRFVTLRACFFWNWIFFHF
jgi:hypothetical protein